MTTARWRLGLAALLTVSLAACGSDDDESGDNGASATAAPTGGATATGAPADSGAPADTSAPAESAETSSPAETPEGTEPAGEGGMAEAESMVEQYSVAPGPVDLPPLSETPPEGLRIAYAGCDQTNCTEFADAFEPVAEILGWTFDRFEGPITPEAFNASVASAMQTNPDGVIINNLLPTDAIQASIDLIEAADIPYAVIAGNPDQQDPDPANNFIQNQYGAKVSYPAHRLLAAWVAADSGGDAKIGFFHENDIFILTDPQEVFKQELARLCPDCELDDQLMALADIGTRLPSQVVSYVQANPDVEYLYFPFGGSTLGISAALQAAGLGEQVKIFSFSGASGNIDAIANGEEAASTTQPTLDSAYFMADAFARYFVGDEPCCPIPDQLPLTLITPETIESGAYNPDEQYASEDVDATFRQIWGVG